MRNEAAGPLKQNEAAEPLKRSEAAEPLTFSSSRETTSRSRRPPRHDVKVAEPSHGAHQNLRPGPRRLLHWEPHWDPRWQP